MTTDSRRQRDLIRDSLGWSTRSWAPCLAFWERRSRCSAPGPGRWRWEQASTAGSRSGWLLRALTWCARRAGSRSRRSWRCTATTASRRECATPRSTACQCRFVRAWTSSAPSPYWGRSRRSRASNGRSLRSTAPCGPAVSCGSLRTLAGPPCTTGFNRGSELVALLQRGVSWRYLDLDELPALFAPFDHLEYMTTGVTALLGRTNGPSNTLATLDRFLLNRLTRDQDRYIVICLARKAEAQSERKTVSPNACSTGHDDSVAGTEPTAAGRWVGQPARRVNSKPS